MHNNFRPFYNFYIIYYIYCVHKMQAYCIYCYNNKTYIKSPQLNVSEHMCKPPGHGINTN